LGFKKLSFRIKPSYFVLLIALPSKILSVVVPLLTKISYEYLPFLRVDVTIEGKLRVISVLLIVTSNSAAIVKEYELFFNIALAEYPEKLTGDLLIGFR
jgi:hypothetical protein